MDIFSGGANAMVTISTESQWTGFKNLLRDTPKSVVEVRVVLKSGDLIQWKKSPATAVKSHPTPLTVV